MANANVDFPFAATGTPNEPLCGTGSPLSGNESTVHGAPSPGGVAASGLFSASGSHYQLEQQLARGGMGSIRAARDRRFGRTVAIKEILVDSPELTGRFEREARITACLQHPSIVGVYEAGLLPTGQPFLAMPLIRGRSLEAVVAETRTLDQRLALLPNVLAVADAMAYAHGEGVIHRDLKPRNVLVGPFGETVVIDWGLAKRLDEKERERGTSSGTAGAGELVTQAGDIIGTPAYMAPEQAEGPEVDERADVYAIGALAYHVLAGRPPYQGKSAVELLARVVDGPPDSLERLEPGLPHDLAAIVARAMARDPARRYPTARELAEDLRRFQTGQLVGAHRYSRWELTRRWLRRHRTPVAVAAVAVVLLAALAAVSVSRIVREQAETTARRRDAEDLMRFMLGSLRDKLEPLNKVELLDGVAQKAVAYYDRKGEDLTETDRASQAAALRTLGDVLSAQGQADRALLKYRAAIEIGTALAARRPDDDRGLRELARAHWKLGRFLDLQGDAEQAFAEHRAARDIGLRLVARAPADKDNLRELSNAHTYVGEALLKRGAARDALVEYRAALDIDTKLEAGEPDEIDRQRSLAISHDHVGDALLVVKDTESALAEYRTALAIRRNHAATDPSNASYQQALAFSHHNVGQVLERQGDLAGALVELREFSRISENLAAADPANVDRQRHRLAGHGMLGDLLLELGDRSGAVAELRTAKRIIEEIVAQRPTDARFQRDLWNAHNSLGELLRDTDPSGAVTEFEAALTIAEKLAAAAPSNLDMKEIVMISRGNLGTAWLRRGEPRRALAELRASHAMTEEMVALQPQHALWQSHLVVGHKNIGDALAANRDRTGAAAEYRAGLDIALRLQARDVNDGKTRSLVQQLQQKLATCCTTVKRPHRKRSHSRSRPPAPR